MGTIIARKQGTKTYYVYKEIFREKINQKDSIKTRGSGRSRVCTRSIYLGTAEKILESVKEKKESIKERGDQIKFIKKP